MRLTLCGRRYQPMRQRPQYWELRALLFAISHSVAGFFNVSCETNLLLGSLI